MEPKDFVHLHVHSHYSLLEALPGPKALVARAKEQGFSAMALTDNGVMYGAVEFFQACKDAGIKPIIGLDAYIAQNKMTDKRPRVDDRPYRLTILAENETGYKNLLHIASDGFLEGFYYKPRIDKDYLRKYAGGLISLSGSLRGEIPEAILNDDPEKAERLALEYRDIFGAENFFLEVVHHPDYDRQIDANTGIIALAKKTGIPLVATKNVFYLNPEDREGYEAQLCIQRGRTLEAFRQTNTEDVDLSFGTAEEIIAYFADVPEAVENTKKIADRVNFEMDLGHNYLPIFPLPEGVSDEAYLHELAFDGLKKRYGEPLPKEILERFEFEYEVIKKMGFASYFIIVQDFVNFAKNKGILVGPGRGSAAGSIISYALRITDLDPMKYGLLFERFLNPDRISMPDVDMDFADRRRGEVMDYVTHKYGADHVAGIITFGTLKPKAAARDAARVLGLSFQEADIIAKAIPEPVLGRHTPLKVAIEEHADLREVVNRDPMARRVIELAMKLEGNPRHASQHACGIVIGDRPLVDRVPIQSGQREDMAFVTQYSLNSAEAAGLVKMDFLGLSNLTIIEDALEIIEAVHGVRVDVDAIPLTDEKTFELLGRGDTIGVFQLESDGMRRYIKELKPTRFEDIVAMVSLYRPGPLSAGMVPQYINRKNGREKIRYDHPLMEEILKETYGVTVYQEQIMKVSRSLAGFTAGEADTLRKAMGKKKRDVLEKMFERFLSGCIENGVPQTVAKKVWTDWEGFADYAFNKSHAACYALISYRTAYLKAHYPSEFMAALMNADIHLIDRITIEVGECETMGIEVLPPDVNESYPGFSVVKATGNIRWGLSAVKNFGEEAAKMIVKERKDHGLFKDLADFAARVDAKSFNKKNIESLIKSGALDRFADRSTMITNLDQILLFNRQERKNKETNQVSMFDMDPTMQEHRLTLRTGDKIAQSQLLSWEKELIGLYISSHPAEALKGLKDKVMPIAKIMEVEDETEVTIVGIIGEIKRIFTKKKQQPMAFVRIEDLSGSGELVIFPKLYTTVQATLAPNSYLLVRGKVSIREDRESRSILGDKIILFTDKSIKRVEQALLSDMWPELESKDEHAPPEVHQTSLTIRMPDRPTHDLIEKLRKTFLEAPGHDPVYLLVKSADKEKKVLTEYAVSKNANLLAQVQRVVGTENAF